MNQQAKPGPDYSGQNLSGRSFRGQVLRGAVFRNADLRGVDFREADLTGADFSGARIGKNWRRWALELPVQFMLGIILGVLVVFGVDSIANFIIKPFPEPFPRLVSRSVAPYYWALLPWMGLQIGFVWLARRGRLEWFAIFMVVDTAVALALADFAGAVALGRALVTIAIGILMVTLGWVVIALGALTVAVGIAVIAPGPETLALYMASAIAITITFLADWWLSSQAIQHEILELNWVRGWSLRFRSVGSTDFRGARLNGANFSNAQLDYSHFAGANLTRTQWHNAINLHLANTNGTVLQAKPIRELMTTRKTQNKDFNGKDLHGLDFSNMNLSEADFTDCDLTGASFNGADLTAAKLTRAVLLGVDLSKARLTGASIGHWNIDKFTHFEGIVCEYVYLDGECKERHPATGEFRTGEFAKLYQEIAHTVDFLIENSEQMEALLRTLEKLRASYDDENIAQVQKVERKGEAYKVSVAVPAEMEEILRKEIRQEFAQQLLESQSHVKLLQNDHQHLQRERDNLKEMLVLSLSRPINVNATAEANAMNDNSRKIENASITNSAVNLGDHAEVNNTTQIGSQLADIGPMLEQLRGLINQSTELPEVLKQDALEKVEILSKAAAKPESEAKPIAAGALESLKTTAKVATGISTVVLALSKLFGF